MLLFSDAEGQGTMCCTMLGHCDEPPEHGQWEISTSRRWVYSCTDLHTDQGQSAEYAVHRPVREQFLREAHGRRGAVLVDAILLCHRVHQDDDDGYGRGHQYGLKSAIEFIKTMMMGTEEGTSTAWSLLSRKNGTYFWYAYRCTYMKTLTLGCIFIEA